MSDVKFSSRDINNLLDLVGKREKAFLGDIWQATAFKNEDGTFGGEIAINANDSEYLLDCNEKKCTFSMVNYTAFGSQIMWGCLSATKRSLSEIVEYDTNATDIGFSDTSNPDAGETPESQGVDVSMDNYVLDATQIDTIGSDQSSEINEFIDDMNVHHDNTSETVAGEVQDESASEVTLQEHCDPNGDGTVDIFDHNFSVILKYLLTKNQNDFITLQEASALNELGCSKDLASMIGFLKTYMIDSKIVKQINGLECFVNLQRLCFDTTASEVYSLQDITPLAGLLNLYELYLAGAQIQDISPLKDLKNLKYLDLHVNNFGDITPVGQLVNLTYLNLSNLPVGDVGCLSGLVNLNKLWLNTADVHDISSLAGLINLNSLGLSMNNIEDLSPLSGLVSLNELQLQGNENIEDISTLANLLDLNKLHLQHNKIEDLSPLSGLVNLKELYLSDNLISNIDALQGLSQLNILNLANNEISDISALLNNSGLGEGDTVFLDNNYLIPEGQILELKSKGVKVQY